MDLKKVCIFMIVSFIVVDTFLLVLYLNGRQKMLTVSDKMIESTVEYFAANGVEIDKKIISDKIPDNAIYTFSQDNPAVASKTTVHNLTELSSGNTSSSFVETPDGIVYTVSDEKGTVANFRIYYGVFKFEYTVSGFDKENISYFGISEFENNTSLEKKQKNAVDKFLKCLSDKTNQKYTVTGVFNTDYGTSVHIKQNVYGDFCISDMYVNMLINGSQVVYATGNYIFDDFKRSYKEPLLDAVNALRYVDINVASKIVSEKIVYVLRHSDVGTYYLIPAWEIAYIDTSGENKTQYVDAIGV